jgi:hypothetical protein
MSKKRQKNKNTEKGKQGESSTVFYRNIFVGDFRNNSASYRPNEPLNLSSLPPKKGPGKHFRKTKDNKVTAWQKGGFIMISNILL